MAQSLREATPVTERAVWAFFAGRMPKEVGEHKFM